MHTTRIYTCSKRAPMEHPLTNSDRRLSAIAVYISILTSDSIAPDPFFPPPLRFYQRKPNRNLNNAGTQQANNTSPVPSASSAHHTPQPPTQLPNLVTSVLPNTASLSYPHPFIPSGLLVPGWSLTPAVPPNSGAGATQGTPSASDSSRMGWFTDPSRM